MIKDENEDPSSPKKSGTGGEKRLMERNMRTGARYPRPSLLCAVIYISEGGV